MNHTGEKSQELKVGVAYIRESTERQDEGYSPKKQENDIKAYAKKNNIKLVHTYKDLVSGTKAEKRDEFQQMIKDAKEKKFDVILVFHSSRFARNIGEARKYKELLRDDLGIDVISVTQDFGDVLEPQGFLGEGINELFDAYYSKQLSFWLRKALSEKREQGYAPGNPPLGYYKKKGNTKDWFIEEDEAKIVKEAYKKYGTGKYSMSYLAKEFNEKGYKTKYGNAFTVSSLKGLLQNKAYLGLISSPRRGYPDMMGNHKPIISQTIYDKVQEQIDTRRNNYGRPMAKHRFYLLQGLVYCAHCAKHAEGKPDNAHRFMPKMYCHAQPDKKGNEYTYYACKFRKENKSCKQDSVKCEIIDKQVIKILSGVKVPEEVIQKTLSNIEKYYDNYKETDEDTLKIEKLLRKKGRLNYMFSETEEITAEEYKKQLQEIKAEIKELEEKKPSSTNYKGKKQMVLKVTEYALRNFPKFWNSKMSQEERRAWIQMLCKRIWVKGEKVVGIEPHDDYKIMFVSIKDFGQDPLVAQIKMDLL